MLNDKSSPLPYSRQLADMLRYEIRQQQAAGALYQLSSENELAERHGLSRATVRHALDELERQGWIYRQKGVGSFAPVRRVEEDLTSLVSTTEDMRRRGWPLVTKVLSLERIPAPPHVALAMELSEGETVFALRRLRIVEETPPALYSTPSALYSMPLSLQTAYLPASLCPTLPDDDLTGSLYRLLDSRYGLRLWTGRETLRARGASQEEADWLEIEPGAPVMYAERITYSADGRAIEYLEAVWRGDRYDFKVTLARPVG